jgi:hypothetical protein
MVSGHSEKAEGAARVASGEKVSWKEENPLRYWFQRSTGVLRPRRGPSGRRTLQRSNRLTETASRSCATLNSRINSTVSLNFFRSRVANSSISLSRPSRSDTLSGVIDQSIDHFPFGTWPARPCLTKSSRSRIPDRSNSSMLLASLSCRELHSISNLCRLPSFRCSRAAISSSSFNSHEKLTKFREHMSHSR